VKTNANNHKINNMFTSLNPSQRDCFDCVGFGWALRGGV